MPKISAPADREKFLLVVEVVVRMNGAIFIAEALGFLYFILAAMNFRQIVRSLSFEIQCSTLETKNWWRVRSPSFVFEGRAYRFVFLFCFFEVSRCLNIVVPLRGVHSWFAHSALFQAQLNSCIRLWTHFSFSFCFMEVELDSNDHWEGWGFRAPMKASGTLRLLNSLRACFKCPDRGALDNGSYQGWFVNGAWSRARLGHFDNALSFQVGTWMIRVIFVGSGCKCFLRDCESRWSKVFFWCNDLFFLFLRSVIGNIRDLEWNNASNHASAWVYLLSECTTVRRADLPPGGQIMPIICQSFQMGWTAFASIQVMHITWHDYVLFILAPQLLLATC